MASEIDKTSSRSRTREFLWVQLSSVLIFALGVVGGLLIGVYAYHGSKDVSKAACNLSSIGEHGSSTKIEKCPDRNPVKSTSYEDHLFAPLTPKEMDTAAQVLIKHGIISSLKVPTNLTENFIMYMYLFPPVKEEALSFLDNGGPNPGRYAKVHVQRGTHEDIMEYKVGPLGFGQEMVSVLTRDREIHFNERPYDFLEIPAILNLLEADMDTLKPLLTESFDGATYPRDLYIFLFNGPPGLKAEERETRFNIGFRGFGDYRQGDLINYVPLSGTVHNPGTNVSSWFSYDFYYLNQGPFNTAADLMDAYRNDIIRKVKLEGGYKQTVFDRVFPQRDPKSTLRDHADTAGARSYLPGGPRYTINGNNVQWMGWELEVSGGQVRGPALFNIRFKGERIVYEHAFNEIALNYAMDASGQNSIVYADSMYGIMGGDYPFVAMKGMDCPEYGTTLQSSAWVGYMQKALNYSGICVFEADGQESLWRHAGADFQAGARNNYLVVRMPLTIGNYDYTVDFQFYLDGKIYTLVTASGFIHSSFWDEFNPRSADKVRDAFGYRVSDLSTGPIHDHMFGFKVDMDVVDTKNSFEIINWKAGDVLDALKTQTNISSVPPYFIYNQTRYVTWEKLTKEAGLGKAEDQQFWLMVNERRKNKWGVNRGYQIKPLATGSQSLPEEHPAMKALSFTKYHCAVTKRKEEEQTLNSIYDVNRMSDPKHYFDLQLNDESIVDEDLVSWVTVGFLHVPTSEDIPMTTRISTGFLLRPFNFFDRTATFDMPQYLETVDDVRRDSEPSADTCYQPLSKYCYFC